MKPLFRPGSKSERIWALWQRGCCKGQIAEITGAHPQFIEAVRQRATNPERRKKEAKYARLFGAPRRSARREHAAA
jgi:hypothetical protein